MDASRECLELQTITEPVTAEIFTDRLLLRRPVNADAQAIFDRYASDPVVCRYLAWPRHRNIEDTLAFLDFSDAEWARWSAGPYLIFSKSGSMLYGSTGLAFESGKLASTGYVLAQDSWGKGFATEALLAMCSLAAEIGTEKLYAHVHPDHKLSHRVLEKAAFSLDGTLASEFEFPNLEPGKLFDVVSYSWGPAQ